LVVNGVSVGDLCFDAGEQSGLSALGDMGEGARVNALLTETNGRLCYKELIA
jgi:hypothetical protein